MNVIQNLVPQSKWGLKCPNPMTATRIVIHNTANDASARNEIQYMISNSNVTSYHYAIDDKEIVQGVLETRNAWHAGDGHGPGNRQGIGIEICYSKSGGKRFEDAEKLTAKFVAHKLKERGWGIDKVTKHNDYRPGGVCPHRTNALGWPRFLKMIESELNLDCAKEYEEIIANKRKSIQILNGKILDLESEITRLNEENGQVKDSLKDKIEIMQTLTDEIQHVTLKNNVLKSDMELIVDQVTALKYELSLCRKDACEDKEPLWDRLITKIKNFINGL